MTQDTTDSPGAASINADLIQFIRSLNDSAALCSDRIEPPGSRSNKEMQVHPEMMDLFWGKVAAKLETDCRGIFCNKPVLAHPKTKRIFALGSGSIYVVRVPESIRTNFEIADRRYSRKFYLRGVIDLRQTMGSAWVFGNYSELDCEWCRMSYDEDLSEAADSV